MKNSDRCSYVVALNEFIFILVASIDRCNCCDVLSWYDRARLDAMHNSLHAEQLYLRISNTATPSTQDFNEASTRKLICNQITSNDYFYERNEYPVDEDSVREILKTQNKVLYKLIYKWRKSSFSFFFSRSLSRRGRVYENPYVLRKFFVQRHAEADYTRGEDVKDYAFICLTSGNHVRDLRAYFVTKQYEVGDNETISPHEHIVGRFVFTYKRTFEALIEEAAWARVSPGFNVEVYYIKKRQRYHPAPIENGTLDPLCRMTVPENGPNNQWLRLCKTALGSLYFKTKVKHPRIWDFDGSCHLLEVSFQTDDAKMLAANSGMKYYEWMVPCSATRVRTEEEVLFFISRAYATNHVFVYSWNEPEDAIYLENLSRNINVVETEYVRMRNQSRQSNASSSYSVDWGASQR